MLNLFEVHKSERRTRILAAARRLIARRGVERLTLRELAAASQVSVPTVYNLIGGKHALLEALMQQTFVRVSEKLMSSRASGLVDRALALGHAGWSEMLAEPAYFRELVNAFLCSDGTHALRQEVDQAHISLMTGVLTAAQAEGELADWVDAPALSAALYAQYMSSVLRWAAGELDGESFPATAQFGMCLILLGLARGEAARKLARLARESQARTKPALPAVRKGSAS